MLVIALSACANTNDMKVSNVVQSEDTVGLGCQLIQRDLTKVYKPNGYWCKKSTFIERENMKHVPINANGELEANDQYL